MKRLHGRSGRWHGVSSPHARPITTWSVLLGHRAGFLTVPIGHGRVYGYCDVVSPSAEERVNDPGARFCGFAEPVP
jgi:hypothetical protein